MRIYSDRGLGAAIMANSTTTYDYETVFDRVIQRFG